MKCLLKKTKYIFGFFILILHSSLIGQSFSEGFEDLTNLTDWYFQNNSISPNATWGGGSSTIFPAQSGTPNSYLSVNYQSTSSAIGTTISNWLFTPTRTYNNGDVITFYTRTVAAPLYPDRMEIRFSSAGNGLDCGSTETSVGTFTNLLLTINPILTTTGYPQDWTQYTITISGLSAPTNGRVAFRYFVTNGGPAGPNSELIGIDSYTYTSVAAPPINDQCSEAIPLIQGSSCNPIIGTVAYATESQIACSGTANNDVWYSFTSNSTGAAISVNGSSSFDAVYEVFTGNCANLTTLSCVDTGIEGENETSVLNDLNIGQTYYIRVHDWLDDIPNSMTFEICVESFSQCQLQQPIGSTPELENCGNDLNGGCYTSPPNYQQVNCGETIFGTSWALGGNRDIDWYRFNLTTPGNITLTSQAEFAYTLSLVDISNCGNPLIIASSNFSACQNGTLNYIISDTGFYAAIITPSSFNGYPCGTNNDYILSFSFPINASFSYDSSRFCQNTNNQVVTLAANASVGNFSANSPGIIVSASSGEIAVNQSEIGIYTIYNTIAGTGTCQESIDSFVVQIEGPIVEFPDPGVFCPSENATQLIASPTGGLFYGSSIENNEFVPTLGSCSVTYVFIDQNGCLDSASQFISVETPATLTFGQYPELCSNGNSISLDQGLPLGGFYTGTGVSGASFSPAQGVLGSNILNFHYTSSNGCSDSIVGIIIVNESPVVSFEPIPSICDTSAVISLGGVNPQGGVFSGIGVVNQTSFDPSIAGVGTHQVTYTYTLNGCSTSSIQTITVDQCSDIAELSQMFMIFPNPVSHSFSLNGFDGVGKVELYSMEGKLIQIIESQNNEFDVAHLPQSNYLLKFRTKSQTFNLKLIKI